MTDTSGSTSWTYDALGRMLIASKTITYTSSIGNYAYPPSGPNSVRPHAVTTAGSNAYTYDGNGNLLTRVEVSGTQRITYTQA